MTDRPLRLLGVFAHPDDESLGNGGTFVRYAREGVAIVTAADGTYHSSSGEPPHGVAKLYYMAPPVGMIAQYEQVFGELPLWCRECCRR